MVPNQPEVPGNFAVQDLTGKTLGNYVLIRRLGRGGMANVYLAQQTTLNRHVAFKVLKPELAIDKAYVTRFHREAQAAAALNQSNIVQIYEVGEIDGVHFIAQEYVRGQNLRQYLSRNSIVEAILVVSILRQVASALQESSKQGVVHRDIKPENIMIASNGEVKVTDFGLARVLDDQRTDLTQIGITMGTPLYMSPEQAEGSHVDVRSDLYSLGITAWHMLTGRPPFEGENALTIAVKHVKEDLTPLSQIRPDLPSELCDVIHKLTNKKPDDRYQSPALLIKQLRTLDFDDIADWDQLTEKLAVPNEESGIGAATVPQSKLEVTRQLETIMSGHFRPWWRSPGLLASIALTLVAGSVVGLFYAWTHPPDDPMAEVELIFNTIPGFEDAKTQYDQALKKSLSRGANREEMETWWLSVGEYFPAYDEETGKRNPVNTFHARRADLRLAELYLNSDGISESQQRLGSQKALQIYERLERVNDSDFRLTGQAGKALVLDMSQKFVGSEVDHNAEINYLLDAVQNGRVEKIQSAFLRKRIRELLDERYPETLDH